MDRNGPKVRISRYLGIPITKKAARIMQKKSKAPGEGGSAKKFRGKMSVYKEQLLEKQKLRAQYNIQEKQMRRAYLEAAQMSGNTIENIIHLLESRLDAFVYRAGFAPTIYAARQIVGHGHILVNGKKTNIPSFRIKVGDVISIKAKSLKKDMFTNILADESVSVPAYISRDTTKGEASMNYLPPREEISVICNIPLVVEYYSR